MHEWTGERSASHLCGVCHLTARVDPLEHIETSLSVRVLVQYYPSDRSIPHLPLPPLRQIGKSEAGYRRKRLQLSKTKIAQHEFFDRPEPLRSVYDLQPSVWHLPKEQEWNWKPQSDRLYEARLAFIFPGKFALILRHKEIATSHLIRKELNR